MSWEETSGTCTHGLSNPEVSEQNVLPEAGESGMALPWAASCVTEVQSPPRTSLGEQAQAGPVAVSRDVPGVVRSPPHLRVQEPFASELSPSQHTQ